MQLRKIYLPIIYIFLTAISACDAGSKKDQGQLAAPEIENQSNKRIDIELKRLDQDIFLVGQDDPAAFIEMMQKKYADFFEIYCSKIIKVGKTEHVMFNEQLQSFTEDPDIQSIKQDSDRLFKKMDEIENKIEDALNSYHYFFPDSLIPQIITMISGFNYNVVTTDSAIGVSLDMYLGENSRFYEWLNFPKYKIQNMQKDMLVGDIMRAIALSNFPEPETKDDLISHMLYHGKVVYFIRACLPSIDEHLAFGFTNDQLEWCYKNEINIWKHFIDQSLLYAVDHKNVVKYINEGPFTSGFPKESPGRVGVWLGYQIVKGYMKNNDSTLPQLMYNKDARAIFAKSKYKPSKA